MRLKRWPNEKWSWYISAFYRLKTRVSGIRWGIHSIFEVRKIMVWFCLKWSEITNNYTTKRRMSWLGTTKLVVDIRFFWVKNSALVISFQMKMRMKRQRVLFIYFISVYFLFAFSYALLSPTPSRSPSSLSLLLYPTQYLVFVTYNAKLSFTNPYPPL